MTINLPDRDLLEHIRTLERRIEDLERAAGLVSASVGSGGLRLLDGGTLTVEGGSIVIKDGAGNVLTTLSTDGLELDGELLVDGSITIDGGALVVKDGGGATVATLGTAGMSIDGELVVADGGEMIWEDDSQNVRITIAHVDVQGQGAARLEYLDQNGNDRVALGELRNAGTGALVGHGILVEDNLGDNVASLRAGRIFLEVGGGRLWLADGEDDDQLRLADTTGTTVIFLGPVSWGGSPDGEGIYVNDGAGGDVFYASKNRLYVTTSNGSGLVTAGASNSGGSGFRLLRIPN